MHQSQILVLPGLVALIAVSGPAWAQAPRASNVERVQLAVVDSGGASCPRDATLTAWAHTSGPGTVRFMIHNSGGGRTGALEAEAVPGAAGTYLATYTHTFRVTTDVDTQYMAEAAGSEEVSNWVPFRATCGPQARSSTAATGSGSQPPARTAESRARQSTGEPVAGGGAPPARNTPPATPEAPNPGGGTSKPNSGGGGAKQCGATITSTRVGALTQAGGMETAHMGWRIAVGSQHPNSWATWGNARDTSLGCRRSGLFWNCTASARPCEP